MRHRIFQRGRKWCIDYIDPHGRRIREAVGPYREAAERRLMRIQVAIAEGRYDSLFRKKAPVKFEAFARRYFENHIRVISKSIRGQKSKLDMVLSHFKEDYLHEITRSRVVNFRAELMKVNSHSTVNKKLALLSSIFNRAIEWGDYEGLNPVKGLRKLPETNERCRWLDAGEIRRLLEAIDRLPQEVVKANNSLRNLLPKYELDYQMLKGMVLLALNTGLRFGELRSLTWHKGTNASYVDFSNKVLVIHSSKAKSGKPRHVYLNRNALSVIAALPKSQSPYLFYSARTGNPIGSVRKSFAMACKAAGIKDFRFHDLRHTFASHVAMNGGNLYVLKELLGHSTIKMTERYSHLSPQVSRHELDNLGDSLYRVNPSRGTNRAQRGFEDDPGLVRETVSHCYLIRNS